MKKLKTFNRWFSFSGLSVYFCLICIFFSSCVSLPKGKEVNSIDLLDSQNSFFITIPNNIDDDLIEKVLNNNVPNLAEREIKKIVDRIDTLYIGVKKLKNPSIQMVVDGNFPKKLIPKVLNSKNGWDVQLFSPENSSRNYQIYSANDINLSFPSKNKACIGRDVGKMISAYDTELFYDDGFESNSSCLDDYFYHFLTEKTDEIRFYSNNPNGFLSSFFGLNLDLKLVNIAGTIKNDKENENQYIIKFIFKFNNKKFMKAGKALLKLAFGITNSEVGQSDDDSELIITNIRIKKEQIYKFLVL